MTRKSKEKRSSLSQGVLMNTPKSVAQNINTTPCTPPIHMEKVDGDELDGNVPRKITPTKLEHVALPKALSELSLSEKECKSHNELPGPLGARGVEVLMTEASVQENSVVTLHEKALPSSRTSESTVFSYRWKIALIHIQHGPTDLRQFLEYVLNMYPSTLSDGK